MNGQDRIVGIGTVQQQAVKRVTDVNLRKAAGNQRIIQLFIKVHEVAANGFRVHIFCGTVKIVEPQQHESFSQHLIGDTIAVDDFSQVYVIGERFGEVFREFSLIIIFIAKLIPIAKKLRDCQAV